MHLLRFIQAVLALRCQPMVLPAVFILLLAGCNHGIYVPQYQNVPLFQRKGEVLLQAEQSTIQGAVAVGNHLGLVLNGQRVDKGSGHRLLGINLTQHLRMEAGAGYFRSAANNNRLTYECYAGAGFGTVRHSHGDKPYAVYGETFTVPNQNFYLQPAIGYRFKRITLAVSTKINRVSYGQVTQETGSKAGPGFSGPEVVRQDFEQLQQAPFYYVEPALTVNMGWSQFRFTGQFFARIPTRRMTRALEYTAEQDTFFRLGLSWRLPNPTKK